VIGLWGVSFWTPELIRHMVPVVESSKVTANATVLQDMGAFLGLMAIAILTQGAPRSRLKLYVVGAVASAVASVGLLLLGAGSWERPGLTATLGISLAAFLYFALVIAGVLSGGFGRRFSFVAAFALALIATVVVFGLMESPGQVYWMVPLLGFGSLLCFGMYAIYFPELYPTRLRSTGTGFCYNVARYLAAGGLFFLSYLGTLLSFRGSALIFSLFYVVGIVAACVAPETKDKPLADE